MDAPSQIPIARWDSARDVWTPIAEFHTLPIFEPSAVYSEIFMPSGSMRNGEVFERPTLEPRTSARECSSPPGLLPTPNAIVSNDGETAATWLVRRERLRETVKNGNGAGLPLTIAVQLLPTVRASDATGGGLRPRQDGQRSEDRGQAAFDWGEYAEAVARWERETRPPPEPVTFDGKDGAPRLAPVFAEWMMGVPSGHITDQRIWAGMTRPAARKAQLRAAGNGVVPQQADAAVTQLLTRAPDALASLLAA